MPTTTTLTPAQLREELESLRKLATDLAVAEERVQLKAKELDDLDWAMVLDSTYIAAVAAQVREALDAAKGESVSELDALEICQEIQEALDVLTFAIERRDDAS